MKRSSFYQHAQAVLHDWGYWARRPQLWVNLRGCGMYTLYPLPRDAPPPREVRLCPQARRVHSAVMALEDERMKAVLYAFYVRGLSFDDAPDAFKQIGVARTRFYELLKDATIMTFNKARLL